MQHTHILLASAHRNLGALCLLGLLGALALPLGACGDEESPGATTVRVEETDGDDVAYGQQSDVVVSSDGTYSVTNAGEECVQVNEEECVEVSEAKGRYCGDEGAQADIVVVDGEVVDVICYPDPEDGTSVEEFSTDADGNVEVQQNQNGAVVTFSEESDGEPIEGDLTLDAERTTLYGNGTDATIIGGNLTIQSNNSRIRGVTVRGDVNLGSNGSAIAFTEVEGNLTVSGNNATLIEVQVFGDVNIEGNGASALNVGVGGNWNASNLETCSGCYSFNDEDEDFNVADEERDQLLCPGESNSARANNANANNSSAENSSTNGSTSGE